MADVRIYTRDAQIALDALRMRRFLLNTVAEEMHNRNEMVTQEHIRKSRDTEQAIANLTASITKADKRMAFAEPAGVN